APLQMPVVSAPTSYPPFPNKMLVLPAHVRFPVDACFLQPLPVPTTPCAAKPDARTHRAGKETLPGNVGFSCSRQLSFLSGSSPILSVKSGLAHAVAFSLCDRSARRWSACC